MAVIENKSSKFKKCALALAVASGMSLAGASAHAAGLGKLTVMSGLGQPLRAEVTLSATPEELSGMTARLAPAEVFSQAGVEYSSALSDLSFNVEKRKGGAAVLKISSGRPVNDPFLDFLVELNWPTGRLVREYTFLLDPPEFAPVAKTHSTVDARVVETVRDNRHDVPAAGTQAARTAPAATGAAAPAAKAPPPAEKTPDALAEPGQRTVERGETLRKIAAERQHAGVTLEQMLVGIYRNNRQAFIENDINRLKAGAILNIPDEASVAAISRKEARLVYVSAGDFSAYRKKLAAAASAGAESKQDAVAPEQAAGGKITPRVEEKTPAVDASKDQVKVGRADKESKARELERLAMEKSLQESQTRVAMLEKNLSELQKLLEMKNQRLAELEKPAAAVPETPVLTRPAVTPAEPVQEKAPAAAPENAPAGTGAAQETAAEQTAAPVEEEAPVSAVKAAPPPVEKPAAPAPEPEPAPEPGFLEALLEDPLPLAAGAGALALLGGLFLYRRRQQNTATEIALTETLPPPPSNLGPNSVFGTNGGQTVDTGTAPPHTGEFSQAGPGTIDTDEVDPVAEADVYMAYGRDSQAEEILLEAMHKDPSRLAIHAKLLEIYANRRSVKQFETLAGELYAQSGGNGPEWQKVAELGRQVDPSNPLYGASKASSVQASSPMEISLPVETPPAAPSVATPEIATASAAPAAPQTLEFEAPPSAAVAPVQPQAVPPAEPEPAPSFDLPSAPPESPAVPVAPSAAPAPAPAKDSVLEFVAGQTQPLSFATPGLPAETPEEDPFVASDISLDFDLDDSKLAVPEQPAAPSNEPAAAPKAAVVDGMHQFSPEGTLVVTPNNNFTADKAAGDDLGLDGLDFPQAAASPAVAERPAQEDKLPESLVATHVPASVSAFAAEREKDLAQTIVATSNFANTVVNMPDLTSTVVSAPTGADDIDFDVKLSDSVFLGQPMASDFDIGSINLDLGAEPASPAAEPAAASAHDGRWEEVNTKLDLAKAYQEMGDLEGARELLQEVIGEGSIDLVEEARKLLAQIGG